MITLRGTYLLVIQAFVGLICSFLVTSSLMAGNIGLFYNDAFVDIEEGNIFAEASNLRETLDYLGHDLILFDDFADVLNGDIDAVIIPELEKASLVDNLTSSQLAAYETYIEKGGGVIVMGVVSSNDTQNNNGVDFINHLIGGNLKLGKPILFGNCVKSNDIPPAQFVDAPETIENNNAVVYIESGLQANSQVIYFNEEEKDHASVVQFSKGKGSIIYFGWGWWNAFPTGTQDGGWLDLLSSSIETIACHSPLLELKSDYSFSLELNGSFTLTDALFENAYTTCTDAELTFSKSVFSCEDKGRAQIITVTVMDELGRSKSQEINIRITDLHEVCDLQPLNVSIACSFYSVSDNPIESVELILESESPQYYSTDVTGFVNLSLSPNKEYFLHLSKQVARTKEVTSNDLRIAQRHILGLEPFTSPYQYIAADMNQDRILDIADLMIIKKLILSQVITEPIGENWFWVPADYLFSPNQSPLRQNWNSIQEAFIDREILSLKVIGIKAGDVDASY